MYVDDKLEVNDLVYSATIGIGKYNGGGMLQTPDAVADDGLFDLTVIRVCCIIYINIRGAAFLTIVIFYAKSAKLIGMR